MVIVMPMAKSALAQAGNGITVREYFSLCIGGLRWVKQIAFLGREEKEHSVDQPE